MLLQHKDARSTYQKTILPELSVGAFHVTFSLIFMAGVLCRTADCKICYNYNNVWSNNTSPDGAGPDGAGPDN